MKKVISVLILLLFTACAGPNKLLVKNCKDLGRGLFECEEIPKKELGVSK